MEKTFGVSMLALSKKVKTVKSDKKKAVLKHLRKDIHESRESIKEDKKLSSKMKKGSC